jgi:hypothetical protein
MEYLRDAREAVGLLDERKESEQWIVAAQSAMAERLGEIDANLKEESDRAAARMQELERRKLEIEEEMRRVGQASKEQKTLVERGALSSLWKELSGLGQPSKSEPRDLSLGPVSSSVPWSLRMSDGRYGECGW